MAIVPFFFDEDEVIPSAIKEEPTITGAFNPVEDVEEGQVPEEECIPEEDNSPDVNVTINGKEVVNTEEETREQEAAEFLVSLDRTEREIQFEYHTLMTTLRCASYCDHNNIVTLEDTAAAILGYESLSYGSEGIKEIAKSVWEHIKKLCIAAWNHIKAFFNRYIKKPISSIIDKAKSDTVFMKYGKEMDEELGKVTGDFIHVNNLNECIDAFNNIMKQVKGSKEELTNASNNLKSVEVDGEYIKGNIDYQVLNKSYEALDKVEIHRKSSLTECGYKPDKSFYDALCKRTDMVLCERSTWMDIGSFYNGFSGRVESAHKEPEEGTADALKALLNSINKIHMCITICIKLCVTVRRAAEGYISAIKAVINKKNLRKKNLRKKSAMINSYLHLSNTYI